MVVFDTQNVSQYYYIGTFVVRSAKYLLNAFPRTKIEKQT